MTYSIDRVRHDLGRLLREVRKSAGMTGTQLAERLAWSQPWERQCGNQNYPQFEVVCLADMTAIGTTVLEINRFVQTAEFVMVLAPQERGKGHAAEAARLTLDWAFHLAALRMVWLKVLEPNSAGIAAYQKAGFQHAGRLRKAGYWLGKPVDELLMDAEPENFPGPSAVARTSGRPASQP